MKTLAEFEHIDKRGVRYVAQLIDFGGMYGGILMRNNNVVYRSTRAMNVNNVKRFLNANISLKNRMEEIDPPIPMMSYKKETQAQTEISKTSPKNPPTLPVVKMGKWKKDKHKTETSKMKKTANNLNQPEPNTSKRKPFTPYGLNGYLVDKQGNVRLMLDRRASAKTIVLAPEMFNAIAEMVKKTQEQNDATIL